MADSRLIRRRVMENSCFFKRYKRAENASILGFFIITKLNISSTNKKNEKNLKKKFDTERIPEYISLHASGMPGAN